MQDHTKPYKTTPYNTIQNITRPYETLGEVSQLKNGKILDIFQNRGGGKTPQKCLKFKFGHLKTHGGGLNFSKMSQL